MEYGKQQLLGDIQEFKNVFDDYCKAFTEYLEGEINRNSEFQLGHPTLFQLSNQLQVVYLKLPKSIQKRLLEIEFDVFLHCNNVVDFYSYRAFLLEKGRIQKVFTIIERFYSEIDLVRMLVENDNFDKYLTLPKRNFNFYRGYDLHPNLMDELAFEYKKKLNENQFPNNMDVDGVETEVSGLEKEGSNQFSEKNDIFNNAIGKIEKVDKLIGSAGNIVGKAFNLIRKISGLG